MIIHVVQPGETIYTIAADYNVSVTRLVEENGLINPENLVVGQTIVIAYPEQVYIIQEGDTLYSVANAYGVTVMELLRNNPFLSNRETLYQGETLVIRYEKQGNIAINAYAYPFIDRDILIKTLPFLTYLTIFNYRAIEGGEIEGSDDTDIISIAKDYGVTPLMSLSTLTYQGISDIRTVNSILYNEEVLDRHINTILTILREKEYYGLNISLVNLDQENRPAYENFMTKLSSSLRAEGFLLFITITPRIVLSSSEITIERADYTVFGQLADCLLLLTYGWGSFPGPPSPITPAFLSESILENAITMIPAEKIYTGISVIGYDWKSPYIIGISRANALTPDAAVELAALTGSTILFDELSQAPYFEYYNLGEDINTRHVVWFSDARSINALTGFVPRFGIQGAGIWNIMNYFDQMWLVINTQYDIAKVLPEP